MKAELGKTMYHEGCILCLHDEDGTEIINVILISSSQLVSNNK